MFNFLLKGAKFGKESMRHSKQLIYQQSYDPSAYVCISTQTIQPNESEDEFKANSKYEFANYDHKFLRTFTELNDKFYVRIRQFNWKQPTLPQAVAYYAVLNGQDLILIAYTGSGKTAAYLLPILQKLSEMPTDASIAALVLCPTRELCEYTLHVANQLACSVKCQLLGQNKPYKTTLAIATPGTALKSDFLGQTKFLVLDECDLLLSKSKIGEVDQVLQRFKEKPQGVLLSASFSDQVELLSKTFLYNPCIVQPKRIQPTATVSHRWMCCGMEKHKFTAVRQLLGEVQPPAIIFCRQNSVAKELQKRIASESSYPCLLITGEMNQSERLNTFRQFRNQNALVLVCTDAASRGLDFKGVRTVIQLDAPQDADTYIHRAGRAGRQVEGVCCMLYTISERRRGLLEALWRMLEERDRSGYLPLSEQEKAQRSGAKEDDL